jgi:hypothetical protein
MVYGVHHAEKRDRGGVMERQKRLARMRAPCYLGPEVGLIPGLDRRAADRRVLRVSVDTFATFLAPLVADTIEAIVLASAAIGELSFVAYLLIRGVRVRQEEPLALAPAAS